MSEVQTRNGDGEILIFPTIREAFEHAKKDLSVWKISFDDLDGQRRLRFIREEEAWFYDPLSAKLP